MSNLTREERIERAEKEVGRLCSGRDRSFRMTVPPEPDRDSDLLLIDGLDRLSRCPSGPKHKSRCLPPAHHAL